MSEIAHYMKRVSELSAEVEKLREELERQKFYGASREDEIDRLQEIREQRAKTCHEQAALIRELRDEREAYAAEAFRLRHDLEKLRRELWAERGIMLDLQEKAKLPERDEDDDEPLAFRGYMS